MTDDEQTKQGEAADQSAFAGGDAPHKGAEDDPSRTEGDLSTEDLAEGGPAGA